jgi:hypothetical protein
MGKTIPLVSDWKLEPKAEHFIILQFGFSDRLELRGVSSTLD